MTKNEVNLDEIAQEDYQVEQSEWNGKYNKTSMFLLPMLKLNIRNKLMIKYLRNAFLDDKGIEHDFVRPIFLLFSVKNYNEREWQDLDLVLRNKEDLKDARLLDYDLGIEPETGNNLIMVVFQTPEKWKDDYYHFKAGRYSKMSNEFKSEHPEKLENRAGKMVESKIWGALNKSNLLKEVVAKEFCVKDDKGNIKNMADYFDTRKALDEADEIWDLPKREQEYYRFK